MQGVSREIRLKRWPVGLPVRDDFAIEEVPVPDPGDGQVLVENRYMSVDPYMRGRLRPGSSYVAPFEIGAPLSGGAVGIVRRSRSAALSEGTYVLSGLGFRESFVAEPSALRPLEPGGISPSAFLGVMGMPGMTAHVGLHSIGQLREGDTVFVSAAAGAVGSAACQIARIRGCTVIGSAGSDAKVDWLVNTAKIAAFNYKSVASVRGELSACAPAGIDLYFDNVAGEHLEAAIGCLNTFGRIVACGAITTYNNTSPVEGPRNLGLVVSKRLRMQGFIVSDHQDQRGTFESEMRAWIESGDLAWEETVYDGLDQTIDAFAGLFEGHNLGKMIVKLA